MHPISTRSVIYVLLLFFITVPIIVFGIIGSPPFIFVLVAASFFTEKQKIKFHHKLYVVIALGAICYPVFVISHFLFYDIIKWKEYSLAISIILPTVAIFVFRPMSLRLLKKIIDAANIEDQFHTTIKYHPNLICELHDTRPSIKRYFGYRSIVCKDGDQNCLLDGKIGHAKNIIGLVGRYTQSLNLDGDYYVPLWDEENKQARVTDCNIIEIHECGTIKDYDAVINKVILQIYNEVGRTNPINKVPVRIIGKPNFKESTWRLMKDRFLEVEPAESEYLRYC